MAEPIILTEGKVQGDITTCKIETAHIKTERFSIFSPVSTNSYRSYDVCTKQVVNDYNLKELSFVGFLYIAIVCIALAIVLASWLDSNNY